MKNALLIPLRYLILLLIFVLIVLFCTFGIEKAAGGDFSWALGRAVRAAVDAFPALGVCACLMSSFIPLRHKGNYPLSLTLLFAMTFLSLSFGTMGLNAVFKGPSEGASQASFTAWKAGMAVRESTTRVSYAESMSLDGRKALGSVVADFSALPVRGQGGILSYLPSRDALSLRRAAPEKPAFVRSVEAEALSLRSFVTRGGFLADILAAGALALLFTSLWIFPRLPEWRLAGVFLALAAYKGALTLVSLAVSEEFRATIAGISTAAIAAWTPHVLFVITATGLILWDVLTLKRRALREEEA